MAEGWGKVAFSDLYQVPSRNGVMAPSSGRGSGPLLVNMREIFAYDRISDQQMERAPLPENRVDAFLLRDGDLLFARQSLTLAGAGKVAIVSAPAEPMTFESHIIRVRLDPNLGSAGFYFQLFRSSAGKRLMRGIVEQVATAGIRSSDLGRLEVPLPPLKEQERIACLLGAFDELIETNRRLATDLLSLLFARHAARGRAQPQTTFGNVARLVRDQWKPGNEGPDRYLGLEHFATDGAGLIGVGSSSNIQSVSLRFARGDVLYGKLRPYFRKVARPGFDGLCSNEVWVLRAREGYPQFLVHALAHSPRFSEVAMAGSGGTRMPRADWKQVSALPVPDLPRSAFSATEIDALEALWSAACELDAESNALTRQRDELLPLLISGKVRVRDVETAIS